MTHHHSFIPYYSPIPLIPVPISIHLIKMKVDSLNNPLPRACWNGYNIGYHHQLPTMLYYWNTLDKLSLDMPYTCNSLIPRLSPTPFSWPHTWPLNCPAGNDVSMVSVQVSNHNKGSRYQMHPFEWKCRSFFHQKSLRILWPTFRSSAIVNICSIKSSQWLSIVCKWYDWPGMKVMHFS